MRTNRKVNQVWLVVLLSFVMVITIMWNTYSAVSEIEANTLYISSTSLQTFSE